MAGGNQVYSFFSDPSTIKLHNRKTHVRSSKLTVGKIVLVAQMHGPCTKMAASWTLSSRGICNLSEFTVQVDDPLTHTV